MRVPLSVGILFASLPVVAQDTPAKPTYADVSYGPHERNVLDFWKAEGEGPRPLLVYIHGGGWTRLPGPSNSRSPGCGVPSSRMR